MAYSFVLLMDICAITKKLLETFKPNLLRRCSQDFYFVVVKKFFALKLLLHLSVCLSTYAPMCTCMARGQRTWRINSLLPPQGNKLRTSGVDPSAFTH